MVVDELDALRSTHSSCKTLAFADISTKMILVTDTSSNLPREALDALCSEAALVLGTNGKIALGAHPSQAALMADKKSVRVFLRAANEPSDVLCCVCGPNVDVDKFVANATDCLNRISSGGA